MRESLKEYLVKKRNNCDERILKCYLKAFNHLITNMLQQDQHKNWVINPEKEIDYSDLNNPESAITSILLFLYSMDPPIYFGLNRAARKFTYGDDFMDKKED